ncbi:FUSC family protein [Microbacterium sp.]|uniref:FUSC family protein n=1 Tax=Microbacterium sp. TaxID=51671 RepID=UPI0028115376|nr:aromatic acid exporter family protein [Microbacterium sp.]
MSARRAIRPARLLLAAKTALAVGLAWVVGHWMPGSADEYPYYAPLGALVSMYPTLMGSAKMALQTLLGLAAGAGLAALVVITFGPNVWTVPIAVGIGVLVSGTGWFGAGQEYVPIAALFVLIIGGPQADDYSVGYLSQMGIGLAIGLVVNFTIAPAPFTAEAAARIDAFQRQLADHLRQIGDAVTEPWPPEHDAWARDAGSLAETIRDVRLALAEADDSRRGNPRAWRHRHNTDREHQRLEMLDGVAHHIRDVSRALSETIWDEASGLPLDPHITDPLARACHAIADVVEQAGDESPAASRAREHAARAVRVLVEAVDDRSIKTRQTMGPGVLTAMHLRNILLLVR